MQDPVVQISDEDAGEIVYTIRIRGTTFRPRVFKRGRYSVRIGEPGTPRMKVVEHLESAPSTEDSPLVFAF